MQRILANSTTSSTSTCPSNEDLDGAWLVLNAQNVFIMQVGFMLLEETRPLARLVKTPPRPN